MEAIIWRKQKKEREFEEKRIKELEANNRAALTQTRFTYDQTKSLMRSRVGRLFPKFKLDEHNSLVFEALLYYFSEDQKFLSIAQELGTEKPSLNKGILLMGLYGVGKTVLMKLFCQNQRQVYHIHNAKKIADSYEQDGQEVLTEYIKKKRNPINDVQAFFQPYAGLCIDDIGTEDKKSNYGNKKNVIRDLIELRYAEGDVGIFLHATTNMSQSELKEYYGDRVASRCLEIFNFIFLGGPDRREHV